MTAAASVLREYLASTTLSSRWRLDDLLQTVSATGDALPALAQRHELADERLLDALLILLDRNHGRFVLVREDARFARPPAVERELELPPPAAREDLHWIEIELLDQNDEPYPAVSLKLAYAKRADGPYVTDDNGYVYITSLPAGTCRASLAGEGEAAGGATWASIQLSYADGAPIPGTGYEITSDGEEPVTGALDEVGAAFVEWRGGAATLRFPRLRTSELTLIDGVELAPEARLELTALRAPVCHRITGMLFDTAKAFMLPGGLEAMREVRAAYEAYEGYSVAVVGHTDTVGRPSYNKTLSLERADAVAAFLRDDVDAWLAWYDNGDEDKRWGLREDLLMVSVAEGQQTRDEREDPLAWFQRTRGLEVTGKGDPATRKALITEYMAADGTSLPEGTELKTRGDGEQSPIVDSGDNRDEPRNRRVEIFFCAPGKDIPPPPPDKPDPDPDKPEVREVPTKPPRKGGLRTLRLVDSEGEVRSQQREVSEGGVLEVVPPSDGGNRIEVVMITDGPPLKPPTWTVSGGAQRIGSDDAFDATATRGNGWNPAAKPRQYVVSAEVPDVNGFEAAVHAYPNDAFELGVNFDEPATWKKIAEAIEKVLDFVGGKFKLKKPRGKWELQAAWREADDPDPRAFYWFELVAKLDPLVGFDGVELNIGPDKILKWIKKILKRLPGKIAKKIERFLQRAFQANGYLKLSGETSLDVDMERTGPEQSLESVTNHGKGLTGTPIVEIGLQASIGDDPDDDDDEPVVALKLFATGSLPISADVFVDKHGFGLELSVRLSEVKGTFEAELLGLGSDSWDVTLFDAPKSPVFGPERFYVKRFD